MLVIHAHWRPPRRTNETGSIFFWAESSDKEEPFYFKGRLPKRQPPKEHLFALTADELREKISGGTPLAKASTEMAKLRLPSTRTGPVPSPELAHHWNLDTTTPLFLAPWLVEGLELSSETAFVVLVSLPLRGPNNAYVLGADALYWRKAANLVMEILAAQKVVPVLECQNGGTNEQYLAQWEAVLDGEDDGTRLARLAAAMPPVCLMELLHPNGRYNAAPMHTPRGLLESFVNTMCDVMMRAWGRSVMPAFDTRYDTPFQAWIKALFSSEKIVHASNAQLESLQSSLNAWMRDLQAAGDENFRVAFSLASPTAEIGVTTQGEWTLGFNIQSRHDPSLVMTAEEIWQTMEPALEIGGRRIEFPQERLLAGLGYASRLYPPLMESLQDSQPKQITLSTENAYQFMRQAAPLLKQAGFGIVPPSWWNQKSARLGIRLHLSPKTKSVPKSSEGSLSLSKLVNYRWEMALGETSISRQEFDALVAMRSPLVQVNGQWIQLDKEQIEAANRFFDRPRNSGTMNLLEAAQYGLANNGHQEELPVSDVVADDWVDDWLKDLSHHDRVVTLQQPATMKGTLRPYQVTGYSWLAFFQKWGLGAILADDMGLGKTIQALALLLYQKETGTLDGPVLLVCPTSVVTNWRRESDKFAPTLRTMVHQGPKRLKGKTFTQALTTTNLVLTSYAVARQDAELLQSIEWHAVILDEAQNIKNPNAKQTRVLRQLQSGYRLALTGTPVENRLSELWSIMHFLNPGYLYSRDEFRKRFGMPIERFGDKEATEKLRALVSPFILRRVKTDPNVISDLPEKIEMKEYCTLSEEQAALYEATVRDVMRQVTESEGMARRGLVLKMLMQLKQICNHPLQFEHRIDEALGKHKMISGRSGKLRRLEERLEIILAAGERVLIFTQFASMGHLLNNYLPERMGYSAQFLHGGTPTWQRDEMVRHFQDDPNGPQIFILSLRAGGTGLNLTRASHVIHFDRWWNPAVEDQATDRAFRIGQKNNVQVHKFLAIGTLEERIDEMIESKKGLAEAILGTSEQWLTELSTEELQQLVQLRL